MDEQTRQRQNLEAILKELAELSEERFTLRALGRPGLWALVCRGVSVVEGTADFVEGYLTAKLEFDRT